MENEKKRVLAYSLAKEIEHKKLVEISGGGCHLTQSFCNRLTGSNGQLDQVIDCQLDW